MLYRGTTVRQEGDDPQRGKDEHFLVDPGRCGDEASGRCKFTEIVIAIPFDLDRHGGEAERGGGAQ